MSDTLSGMPKHRNTAESVLARHVSAEVRSRMGVHQLTQTQVADAIGRKQSYVSERLADKAPFTVDDVAHLLVLFNVTVEDFITAALAHKVKAGGGVVMLPKDE